MITATTTNATTTTEAGYIRADLIFDLMASVFSMYTARRSSSDSRIPAASPASTKLQYSALKYIGYFRKAALSDVPVSTSVRTSFSSLVTLALGLPRPTMSNDCSNGTPAFIMVASWRVKMAISRGLMDFPERMRRFLILIGKTPCLRKDTLTWFSPAARISPRTCLPPRSLPSHSNTNSLMPLDTAVAMMPCLLLNDGFHTAWGNGARYIRFDAGACHVKHWCNLELLPWRSFPA